MTHGIQFIAIEIRSKGRLHYKGDKEIKLDNVKEHLAYNADCIL